MTLLGGLVLRDRAGVVDAGIVMAMAARVPGAGAPVFAVANPAALFTSPGLEAPLREGSLTVAGEMDLLDLDDLAVSVGRPGQSPARVVAALYARDGHAFVDRLRGAFALAIWDDTRQELLLAVDPHGIKRLYHASTPGGFAFASRSSALLAMPGAPPTRPDPTAVYEYLSFGFVPAPGSIFHGIARLGPGRCLVVKDGMVGETRYWALAYDERPVSEADAAAATYRAVEEAVGRCLEGVAPKHTGAFLSGGTDSSTVVGFMSKQSGERVNAFSVGFREPRYDEIGYAELAARHFHAAHYTTIVGPDQSLAVVPRLVEAYDEPFGNSSALGTFFCAQLARECGVQSLLAGDGGDEIFGGNERYQKDRVFARYARVPWIVRRGLLEPILLSLPEAVPGVLGRGQRYVRRARLANPRRFYFSEFLFAREADRWLDPGFLATVDREAPWAVLERHFAEARASSELNRLLHLDLQVTIADNDLLKVTRTAEVAGVGVRFPLLDRSLVEHCATLPADFKVRGMEKRYLFKRAFRGLLPADTLSKQKHGFGVPTGLWLKSDAGFRDLGRDALLSPGARTRAYFRRGALETLFERMAADSTPYYGDILWTVLMLELWHRRHDRQAAA